MKINYVLSGTEHLASFRYHIKTPAMYLARMGHEVVISAYPQDGFDAYIFHKHFRSEEQQMILDVKKSNKGCKTYYIVCDYHLDNKNRDHYLRMISRCDHLVLCTEAMKRIVKDETGKIGTVIKDPWGVEYRKCDPKFNPKHTLNVLWFGSKTNITGLMEELGSLGHHNLTVLSDLESGKYEKNGKQFDVLAFSPDRLQDWIRKSDVVVIPQKIDSKNKLVKTHNRMVDTIRMGKFAIASPVDAYKEFSDYAWVGDIKEGFDWLSKQTKETVEGKISRGQEYIEKEFNPAVIARQWESLLLSTTKNQKAATKQ